MLCSLEVVDFILLFIFEVDILLLNLEVILLLEEGVVGLGGFLMMVVEVNFLGFGRVSLFIL